MNSKQENKLSMYIAVRDYLIKFLGILNNLPNFPDFFKALQNIIIQINSVSEFHGLDHTGSAADKKLYRGALVPLAVDTARKVMAYAKFSKNQVLLKEMDISETELKRMPDTTLKNTAQAIYDRAQANLANLGAYMVSASTQTALQTAIANFDKLIGQPRVSTTENYKVTQQLESLFRSGDETIANLDTALKIVQLSQSELFKGYKKVRKIINTGSTTMAIKGLVTDAVTGKALQGVTVTIAANGSFEGAKSAIIKKNITKKSSEKGGFQVRTTPDGTYDYTTVFPGYKPSAGQVTVVSGQMTILEIRLEKA